MVVVELLLFTNFWKWYLQFWLSITITETLLIYPVLNISSSPSDQFKTLICYLSIFGENIWHTWVVGAERWCSVVNSLHFEDVGDDGVDVDLPDEAGEEELLKDVRLEWPEGGQPQQEVTEPPQALGDTFRWGRGRWGRFSLRVVVPWETAVVVPLARGRFPQAVVLQLLDGLVTELVQVPGTRDAHAIWNSNKTCILGCIILSFSLKIDLLARNLHLLLYYFIMSSARCRYWCTKKMQIK